MVMKFTQKTTVLFFLVFLTIGILSGQIFRFNIYMCAALLCVSITILFVFLHSHREIGLNKKTIITSLLLMLFLLHMLVAVSVASHPQPWDPGAIETISNHYLDTENTEPNGWENDYLMRYTPNIPITLVFTLILKVSLFFHLQHPFGTILLVNSLAILIACLAILRSSYLLAKFRGFLVAYPFTLILITISPYSTVFYTDTIGLFFVSLILLVLSILHTKYRQNLPIRNGYYVLLGVLFALGGLMKITVYILLIALIISLLFFMKKKYLKKISKVAFYSAAGISIALLSYIAIFNSLPNFAKYTPDQLNAKQVGVAHYLGMGSLRGLEPYPECKNGVYCARYADYINTLQTKKEKNRYSLSLFKQSILQDFPFGWLHLAYTKTSNVFRDGSFGVWKEGYSNNDKIIFLLHSNITHKIRTIFGPFNNGIFQKVADAVWTTLLILILIFGIHQFRSKQPLSPFNLFLLLSFDGIVMYQILFENRARYIFLFLPLFIIMGLKGFFILYHYLHTRQKYRTKTA